ncbi:MAG TPA: RluA family pseudouridine synthase [Candidatus Rubrimentiphilum sp.]|nr:RluA family pseudouridine synthase [Candidatus Rubrimentiphilum sp.]
MRLAVAPDDAGKRADLVVAHRAGISRSLIAEASAGGKLRVNGEAVKGSYVLSEGDVIEYEVRERAPLVVEPEAIDIPIVYEDEDIIVIDKPAGMVTHPAHGATSGTLVNAILGHVGTLPGDSVRPGLVHRLDRDTSGLLVVAKNAEALSFLSKGMKGRHIAREYLGLVAGIPAQPKGTIDGAIGRDEHNRLKYAITAGGKHAITHYEIRERLVKAAELLFRLETGRTHQIRVHMAALGHPLINDPVYGRTDPRFELPGQALHAWRLSFMHPRTREHMTFETDPPPEYLAAKKLLASP